MGAIRDFLDSVGRTKTPYTGSPIPGPPPADTASTQSLSGAGTARPIASGSLLDTIRNVASNTAPTTTSAPTDDRAAFDESVRKYQLDRRAYEQYETELKNRLRNFNPYADAQYRVASTTPPAGATSVSVPTAAAPTPPTQLRAPTYGAISQFSNLTPQQQGELYLQQRGIGYTDADIRKATAAQVGTPSEEMMAGIYKTAYPQYTQAIESQYGTQFNRSGYGTGAGQIDYPGFNYYINQLSTGAVTPDTLESAIRGGAAATPTPVTTPGTTTPTSDINSLYQQYFNRQADPGGLQYWQQSGLTGDALRNAIIAGAQGPDLDYYNSVYNRPNDPGHSAARGGYISKYADGGRVRTHYQTGGMADEGNLDEIDAFYRDPRNFRRPQSNFPEADPTAIGERRISTQPINNQPSEIRVDVTAPAPEPAPEPRVAAPRSPLEDMLNRYMGVTGEAGRELASARQRSQAESEAFYNLIRQQAERGESPTSRSEMYFRLASAFGAPTRTGQMGETLSNVGQQMSEYTRGRRTEEGERRNLLLRAQEARMGAAREDLATTRALAAQEAQERRALVAKLLEISARDPSERERKIADIMRTNNVDYATAANIVNGIEIIRPNPDTMVHERVNVLTNEVTPLRRATESSEPAAPAAGGASTEPAAPAAGGATTAPRGPGGESARPPRTLYELASVPRTTGVLPALAEVAQRIVGQTGANVVLPEFTERRQAFLNVQNEIIRAVINNPRFPVAEQERIRRELNIEPSVFTDPQTLISRIRALDSTLRTSLENRERESRDITLPRDVRVGALQAANEARNLLQILGVPQGRQEPAPRSQRRETRQPSRPSEQGGWSIQPIE